MMSRILSWLAPPPLAGEMEAEPVLAYQWLLEVRFVRLRWLALPLCALAAPFVLRAPWPVLLFCPLALGLGNAWLVWRLRRAAGGACLRQVRGVATGLDWAVGLLALGLSAGTDAHEALPAVLLLLVLATGLRYGPNGLLGAASGAALLTALLVVLHVVLFGALTARAAVGLLAGWELLIALAALLGWGLLWARGDWYRWEQERHAEHDATLHRLQCGLSQRELAVLRLLAMDLTYEAIGERLHISPSTVKAHTGHIAEKLGVTRRQQVVQVARQRGLLPEPDRPRVDGN